VLKQSGATATSIARQSFERSATWRVSSTALSVALESVLLFFAGADDAVAWSRLADAAFALGAIALVELNYGKETMVVKC